MTKNDIKSIISEIIKNIDGFIDDETITKDQRASYIVGSTLMRDDFNDIAEIEPKIDELAGLASNAEWDYSDQKGLDKYFNEILCVINQIKTKYNTSKD